MSDRKFHIETLAVHAGQDAHGDPTTNARAVPVYRTTAYNFRDSKHGADLFGLRELGNIYARLMNPTNDVLAKRIAALEGGAAAQTLSSGTAAIFFTITNIARAVRRDPPERRHQGEFHPRQRLWGRRSGDKRED